MRENGLTDPDQLVIGQVLKIPLAAEITGPDAILIPDSELVYGPALADFDVDAVIAASSGWLKGYSDLLDYQTMTAAEIVRTIAMQYSISPRLLLTLIEMESGGLTMQDPSPEIAAYPLGYVRDSWDGLAAQLMWAADTLNAGFYGWLSESLWTFELNDGTRVQFSPALNAGTAGIQYLLAQKHDYASWQEELRLFSETYQQLWGTPFQYTVDPLLPLNLTLPTFALPWSEGETWYLSSGPHGGWGNSSAWAALDFVTGERNIGCMQSQQWATAIAPGTIVVSHNGMVLEDLDNDGTIETGWVVLYMHMAEEDRVTPGTTVKTGDPIGHPSCEGGVSNASHLHLARRYNGVWIAADHTQWPFVLEGWTAASSGTAYDGTLQRDNVVKTAEESWSSRNAIAH